MKASNADLSTLLDRILDTAADNLRIAKILVLMGLDPNNVTYDAIFNRLFEIMLAQITLASMCALIGSIFFVATLLMRTMMPLRISNMISNVFFMAFGALAGDIKTFLMYLLISAYQWRAPVSDAQTGQNGSKRHQGRQVDGMAQAFHDRTQISQGRQIIERGRCGQRNVLDLSVEDFWSPNSASNFLREV